MVWYYDCGGRWPRITSDVAGDRGLLLKNRSYNLDNDSIQVQLQSFVSPYDPKSYLLGSRCLGGILTKRSPIHQLILDLWPLATNLVCNVGARIEHKDCPGCYKNMIYICLGLHFSQLLDSARESLVVLECGHKNVHILYYNIAYWSQISSSYSLVTGNGRYRWLFCF